MRKPRASFPGWSAALVVAAGLLQGCALSASFAYTNTARTPASAPLPQASFEIRQRPVKQQQNVLVLLALSGGGSRAAYFSARTMLALERMPLPRGGTINALREVDLVSSVSGGSLAAAYYASTFDAGAPGIPAGRRVWDQSTVADVMGRNYLARWIGNWFWPANIAKFWFTAYDRTDIMAQTFADNLFDSTATGVDLRFQDLNPSRPNLVLNATVGNRTYRAADPSRAITFGSVFTFTSEDFTGKVASDIAGYELARAVMASATFPAVFNYTTLRDFHEPGGCGESGEPCYVHLFDGGNFDNLGLTSIKRALLSNHARVVSQHERIVVILVDAFRPSAGVDPRAANPRTPLSYFIDTDFLDATDSLLEANRQRILDEFFSRTMSAYERPQECWRDSLPDHACPATWELEERRRVDVELRDKTFFFHVAFDAVSDKALRAKLNAIPTTFRFDTGEMEAIEQGVADIFSGSTSDASDCVRRLGEMLAAPGASSPVIPGNPWCGGGSQPEKEKRQQLRQAR